MAKKNSLKRAIVFGATSMALSVSMFVGTTFAWFTDSVTSSNNRIVAGTLNVELYYQAEGQDGWTKVNSETNVFKDNTLWEPGHTEVVKLKVVNEGSLALKYQLGVNIASETPSVNVYDQDFKLSSFIEYGIVAGENDYITRAAAVEAVKDVSTKLNVAYNSGTTKLTVDDAATDDVKENEDIVTMVVYMPTKVGNDANPKDGAAVPEINLGINLYATQVEAEEDSFGDGYDEDAWNEKFEVTTANDLQTAINNGGSVKLANDITMEFSATDYSNNNFTVAADTEAVIDLGGNELTVKRTDGSFAFLMVEGDLTITGEGNVDVRQINASEGSKLTISEGVTIGASGFSAINNSGTTVINGATINHDNTNANGNAIQNQNGGTLIINNATVTSNSNKNVHTINNDGGTVTVNGGTFTHDGSWGNVIHQGYSGEIIINGGTFTQNGNDSLARAEWGGKLTIKGGTFNSDPTSWVADGYKAAKCNDAYIVVPEDTEVVNNNDELKAAIKDGATIYLAAGEYSLPDLAPAGQKTYEGVTIIGAEGAVIGGENVEIGFSRNIGKNTTIKNVTFSGTISGVCNSYGDSGTTTFENCTFEGGTETAFHVDDIRDHQAAYYVFNDCTFIGKNAFTSSLDKITFTNCTFLSNGKNCDTSIYSKESYFNNCTWGDNTSVSPKNTAKLYFDGNEESYRHEFIGSAETLAKLADSVAQGETRTGQTILLVNDIDLKNVAWTPIGNADYGFMGTFDGCGYTISNYSVTATNHAGLFGYALNGGNIKNLKVKNAVITANDYAGAILGRGYTKVVNCHAENVKVTVTPYFDEDKGTYDGGAKAGAIVGQLLEGSGSIVNCSATNVEITGYRDLGGILGMANAGGQKISGCSVTGVIITYLSVSGAYDSGTPNQNANAIVGRVQGGVTVDSNTWADVTLPETTKE